MNNSILNKRFKYSYKNATLDLVVINVIVYMIINTVWPNGVYYLSMIPGFIMHGYVYQFITYMFVHGSFSHLLFNMLSLYIFGQALEKRIGTKEFLLFYFSVGILAGIASFAFYYFAGQNAVLLGASGAIYGLLLLFAVFFPFARIYVFGLLPVKAPFLILGYFLIEVFSQVSGVNGGVAHLTHLSGLAFGYLYCLLRMKLNPIEVWRRTL
ncbi:MAG: rhomboid family intramembrane serine protease [Sphaerochaetaceae bacterium]|nr:rhomboid family intramembrane serine protease [Sphaerochaetaceae bacterium]